MIGFDWLASPKLFPCVMIGISLAAAARYGFDGDLRRFVYWVAAAVLTASVTF